MKNDKFWSTPWGFVDDPKLAISREGVSRPPPAHHPQRAGGLVMPVLRCRCLFHGGRKDALALCPECWRAEYQIGGRDARARLHASTCRSWAVVLSIPQRPPAIVNSREVGAQGHCPALIPKLKGCSVRGKNTRAAAQARQTGRFLMESSRKSTTNGDANGRSGGALPGAKRRRQEESRI